MKLVLIVAIYCIFTTAALAGLFPLDTNLLLAGMVILALFLMLQTYLIVQAEIRCAENIAAAVKKMEKIEQEGRRKVEGLEQQLSTQGKQLAMLTEERDGLRERYNEALLGAKEGREHNEKLEKRVAQLQQSMAAEAGAQGERHAGLQRSAVINLLAEMQDKGRLLDFLMDDVTPYPDAQVGAAARVVHQGASRVLKERLRIAPVYGGQEGDQKTLSPGFDVREWRLVGRVTGSPPFTGQVTHRGWKIERFNLPAASMAGTVVTPAEVEVR